MIVGRGTWIDKVGRSIIEREQQLKRSVQEIRVESGLGASGFPHLGSLSDALRAYAVRLSLEDQGYKSKLIAFSDDMDGLRKVPVGLPKELEQELGKPVSRIMDPLGCHKSYGEHMGLLLVDALDRLGVQYEYLRGSEVYRRNLLIDYERIALKKAEAIGAKMKVMLGQEKYESSLPYFVVCPNCGRIYTTRVMSYDEATDSVHFKCEGTEIRGRRLPGCGYEGDIRLTEGEGKLSWKVELAARWASLGIRFEAYGKDIYDSVKFNDWVADEVFGYPHPYHIRYEMFLDKGGKKISKSAGNVLTPQSWLRYGSDRSLLLLMYKRIAGSRAVSLEDVPKYMDEYDRLEDIYFGRVKEDDQNKLRKLKGLYEYVNFLKPPQRPETHVAYNLLVQLASVAPEDSYRDFVKLKLKSYGALKDGDSIDHKIDLAYAWAKELSSSGETGPVELSAEEISALQSLLVSIREASSPSAIQDAIFNVSHDRSMEPSSLFRLLYRILLGTERGPRLGPYIYDIGVRRAENRIRSAIEGASETFK